MSKLLFVFLMDNGSVICMVICSKAMKLCPRRLVKKVGKWWYWATGISRWMICVCQLQTGAKELNKPQICHLYHGNKDGNTLVCSVISIFDKLVILLQLSFFLSYHWSWWWVKSLLKCKQIPLPHHMILSYCLGYTLPNNVSVFMCCIILPTFLYVASRDFCHFKSSTLD